MALGVLIALAMGAPAQAHDADLAWGRYVSDFQPTTGLRFESRPRGSAYAVRLHAGAWTVPACKRPSDIQASSLSTGRVYRESYQPWVAYTGGRMRRTLVAWLDRPDGPRGWPAVIAERPVLIRYWCER